MKAKMKETGFFPSYFAEEIMNEIAEKKIPVEPGENCDKAGL